MYNHKLPGFYSTWCIFVFIKRTS